MELLRRARLVLMTRGRAETQLLQRAQSGEREAIQILVGRHRERVLNLAFSLLRDRAEAEDAAQEIFLRAFGKLPGFRGESEFSTWLYRLALNFCLERCRVQARRDELLEACDLLPTNGENIARRVEMREQLHCALDGLSEPLRLALILREWQGLSYQEIAEVLRLPVGTVRSRLHQARQKFQQKWLELEDAS